MLKIWAKIMSGDKIVKDTIYGNDCKFEQNKLMDYLVDICYDFDVPTPMILKCHKHNFKTFNVVRFKKTDFVESVDFDFLILENASDDSKQDSGKKMPRKKFDVFND